ncbi:MAG: hypothetical protein LH613_19300 [Chamaesiphon sp.]|nr:hypothetical protein [Chamaesiphon sp.]
MSIFRRKYNLNFGVEPIWHDQIMEIASIGGISSLNDRHLPVVATADGNR